MIEALNGIQFGMICSIWIIVGFIILPWIREQQEKERNKERDENDA